MGPENNDDRSSAADDSNTTVYSNGDSTFEDDLNTFVDDNHHDNDYQAHFPHTNGTLPFESLSATSESISVCASAAGQHDYHNNSHCHSPVITEVSQTKTKTTMEYHSNGEGSQMVQSNGWNAAVHNAIHTNGAIHRNSAHKQASANHLSQRQQVPSNGTAQQSQTASNSASTTKVVFDYNKNLQCEMPLSSAEIAGASVSTSGAKIHKTTIANGHVIRDLNHSSNVSNGSTSNERVAAINKTRNGKRKQEPSPKKSLKELYEEPPKHIAIMCYLSYVVLIFFGYLRDFMRKTGLEKNLSAVEKNRQGYPSLYKNFEAFYTRNIYRRIRDCWNRPIASVPGAYIDLIDRYSRDYNYTFEHPGTTHKEINMGSYNYLGFAENSGPVHDKVLTTLHSTRVGVCSPRAELGNSSEVARLEELMATFLGTEASIVFGMGFATNSCNIATLVGKGSLIFSDALNHASLILGCRLSGATIKTFKHNDMVDLERKVRKAIIDGQPKSLGPWRKMIILVEGIYSMEGTIINLPELIRIKKRYRCAIYLDEAHSIGALGPNGRGVVDYYGCEARDVDVLMGTFTKSFAGAGGYIGGSQALVEHVRAHSFSSTYAVAMSPVIARQIASVVEVLLGVDGSQGQEGAERITQLARNTRYFRRRLLQMGFIVYGNDDSPVVPLLLCFCPKIAAVIRLAMDRGLGFIGAGYPATSLTTGRVRFCISAAHTKSILDQSLEVMNQIGDQIGVKYSRLPRDMRPVVYDEC